VPNIFWLFIVIIKLKESYRVYMENPQSNRFLKYYNIYKISIIMHEET